MRLYRDGWTYFDLTSLHFSIEVCLDEYGHRHWGMDRVPGYYIVLYAPCLTVQWWKDARHDWYD